MRWQVVSLALLVGGPALVEAKTQAPVRNAQLAASHIEHEGDADALASLGAGATLEQFAHAIANNDKKAFRSIVARRVVIGTRKVSRRRLRRALRRRTVSQYTGFAVTAERWKLSISDTSDEVVLVQSRDGAPIKRARFRQKRKRWRLMAVESVPPKASHYYAKRGLEALDALAPGARSAAAALASAVVTDEAQPLRSLARSVQVDGRRIGRKSLRRRIKKAGVRGVLGFDADAQWHVEWSAVDSDVVAIVGTAANAKTQRVALLRHDGRRWHLTSVYTGDPQQALPVAAR